MKPYYIFLATLTMALWGFNFVFAKIALDELPLFAMMAIRFFIVGICLVPFFKKPPASLPYLALIAFIFSVPHVAANFGGLVMGLDAGMATLVEQTNAPFLLIVSALIYKEKIGVKSIVGIMLSFIGTYFLMQAPTSVNAPIGFALVLCGAFFWAIYSLLLKKVKDVHPLSIIGWVALLAAPMNAILSLIFEQGQFVAIASASYITWIILMYMVIGASFGAHALWYHLISKVPMDRIAPTTLMVPLFGVLGGVIFIGEQLSFQMVMGGLVMLVGVAIVMIRRPKTFERDIDVQ